MLEKKVKMVPLNKISIEDNFWKKNMELVRNHVIPYQWDALNDKIEGAEPSHCIQNFRVAAGKEEGSFQGMVFQDSDVYKWLEAVSYSLMWAPDVELEATADQAIEIIGAAQQPDGYLDTYYILNGLDKRFTNLMDNHELYCFGHMVEAAVAYYKATGKRRFLDIAIGFTDCINNNIGLEAGKKNGYPGHEVAEMALVGLYEVTKNPMHLALAKYFVDQRGQKPLYFENERKKNENKFHWKDSYFQDQYYQSGKPVREQDRAQGHAVRGVYLYSGMADVASASKDQELFEVCQKIWNNIVEKQIYITGAIGASQYGESFTFDYDLPNDTVYGETCAAIGLVFFARRMFEITKNSRYIDIMERCLYNGIISGMSLDGKKFFYVNPLEALPEASEKDFHKNHVKVERQKWFGCACCPPNIARLLSSIGGYAYEYNNKELFMNLFIGGTIEAELDGQQNTFTVKTNYPWDGNVTVKVQNEGDCEYTYAIRIPAWCHGHKLLVNEEVVDYPVKDGFLYISRCWKNGDEIKFSMEMPVELMEANPRVREDIGKAAIMRGPIVFCLEEADNGGQLHRLLIDANAGFTEKYEENLLSGVMTLTAKGKRILEKNWDEKTLYQSYSERKLEDVNLKFIPYYAWTNRSVGEMIVWVRVL